MADEKDRLGDKLHDAEKAREDQWAHEEDRKLIEKQRRKMAEQKQEGASLQCPQCGKPLVATAQSGIAGSVAMMACPDDHGAWLDSAALKSFRRLGR
jgi:hypothetical protein